MRLPEVRAMAVLRLAGLDHRPLLYSADSAEVAVEQAVGQAALKLSREYLEQQRKNLAVEVGNQVGRVLRRVLG